MRMPNLQHTEFYRVLCVQLFHKASNTPIPSVRPDRQANRATTGSVDSPLTLNSSDSEDSKSHADTQILPSDVHQFARFRGTYKRSCYYCRQQHVFTLGGVRNKGGLQRKEYPRSHTGCKTCNVALCTKGDCWKLYHLTYCGQNDNTDPTGSFWDSGK
jgi:hypothetical protein